METKHKFKFLNFLNGVHPQSRLPGVVQEVLKNSNSAVIPPFFLIARDEDYRIVLATIEYFSKRLKIFES